MDRVSFFAVDSEHRKKTLRDSSAAIFVLPIVLRYDKSDHLTELNVFKAAAQHMANIMSDSRTHSEETEWGKAWRAWERQQFRKVVRRAKPGPFAKLLSEQDAILTEYKTESGGTIQIISLTPHTVDAPDRRLRNFQVSGLALPHNLPEPAKVADGSPTMLIDPNYGLGASTGKMVAQVCHAVQLMIYETPADVLELWEDGGRKVVFAEECKGNRPEVSVKVVDAGFTELPPNSVTVKSSWLNTRRKD